MIISPNKIVCDSSLLASYKEITSNFLSEGRVNDYYNIALPLLIKSINNNDADTCFTELLHFATLITRSCYIGGILEKAKDILFNTLKTIGIAPQAEDDLGLLYCENLVRLEMFPFEEDDPFEKIDVLLEIISCPFSEVYLRQYFFRFLYLINCRTNLSSMIEFIIDHYNTIRKKFLKMQDWEIEIIKTDESLANQKNFYSFYIIFYLYYLKEEKDFSEIDLNIELINIFSLSEEKIIEILYIFSSLMEEKDFEDLELLSKIKNFLLSSIQDKNLPDFSFLIKNYALANVEKWEEEKIKNLLVLIENKKIDFLYIKPLHTMLFSYFLEYPTKENVDLGMYILKGE